MPELLAQIAADLESPESNEVAANSLVHAKARQLGELRYEQQAAIHEILREFEVSQMPVVKHEPPVVLAEVIGARPGTVLVTDSVTVNLYKLVNAVLDGDPALRKLATDRENFPTGIQQANILAPAWTRVATNNNADIHRAPGWATHCELRFALDTGTSGKNLFVDDALVNIVSGG